MKRGGRGEGRGGGTYLSLLCNDSPAYSVIGWFDISMEISNLMQIHDCFETLKREGKSEGGKEGREGEGGGPVVPLRVLFPLRIDGVELLFEDPDEII